MLASSLTHGPFLVRSDNTTNEGRMTMLQDRDENDWGSRAVHWLRSRFVNWPMKAIAREINEPETVVIAWFRGSNLPSRQKLQKLNRMFARDGFSSFVFGEPCREELRARLDNLTKNLVELRDILDAQNQRSAGTSLRLAGRKT